VGCDSVGLKDKICMNFSNNLSAAAAADDDDNDGTDICWCFTSNFSDFHSTY